MFGADYIFCLNCLQLFASSIAKIEEHRLVQYSFHNEPLTFKQSKNWCLERNMHLVEITSATMHASFTNFSKSFGSPALWMPLYQKKYKGNKWVNDIGEQDLLLHLAQVFTTPSVSYNE